MESRLVALRLPAGWAVLRNTFYDDDGDVSAGDLLWMERVVGDRPLSIQVAWRDREAGGGSYRVVLRGGDDNRVLKRFAAVDREEVRTTIEHWLDALDASLRVRPGRVRLPMF